MFKFFSDSVQVIRNSVSITIDILPGDIYPPAAFSSEPSASELSSQQVLLQIFSDPSDARVALFQRYFNTQDLLSLADLRKLVLVGTAFEGRRIELSENEVSVVQQYHQCCPKVPLRSTVVPGKYNNIKVLMDSLILDKPMEKTVEGNNYVLFKNNMAWAGYNKNFHYSSVFLASLCTLVLPISWLHDDKRRAQADIDNGLCAWRYEGCSIRVNRKQKRYDCYASDNGPCDTSPLEIREYVGAIMTSMFFLVFILALVSLIQTMPARYIRSTKVTELIHSKFNDEQYDELLDRICEKLDQPKLNWESAVEIDGSQSTLRTLMLTLLVSFDKSIYHNLRALLSSLAYGGTSVLVAEGFSFSIELPSWSIENTSEPARPPSPR